MSEKRRPGRPAKLDAKVAVTLRLAPSVVAAFKAQGVGWRAEMEAAITAAANLQQVAKPLAAKAKAPAKPPAVKSAAAPAKVSLALPVGAKLRDVR